MGTFGIGTNNQQPNSGVVTGEQIEIAVQINGKTKVVTTIPAECAKDDAIAAGKAALGDKLTGTIVKEIYVPGRIVNIVVKP